MADRRLVLCFRAPDRPGILAAVTPAVSAAGCDIREAQIYGDPDTQIFFVRMGLSSPLSPEALSEALEPAMAEWATDWRLYDIEQPLKVLIAVSKFGHCLLDLIHKTEIGTLPINIVGVVSNHETMRPVCEWHRLPFHHLPMAGDKKAQEATFRALIDQSGSELLVLARYMQILSEDFAAAVSGRCINIHHSFLPSFKGARPYHQAHARGVKLIGATAHYVTSDLDEGPIIEQDVRRVSHAVNADQMVAIGREVEASVLSRAVGWHAERRVFVDGTKTVVLV